MDQKRREPMPLVQTDNQVNYVQKLDRSINYRICSIKELKC